MGSACLTPVSDMVLFKQSPYLYRSSSLFSASYNFFFSLLTSLQLNVTVMDSGERVLSHINFAYTVVTFKQ